MTKIVMPCNSFLPDMAGASVYVNQLSSGLVKRGYEVELFVPHSKKTPHYRKEYRNEETVDGVVVRRFDAHAVYLKNKYRLSFPLLRALLNTDADMVHSHHYGYYPATAGLIASRLRKLPHVFGPYYHPPIYGIRKLALFSAYHMTQGLPLLRLSDMVLPHTEYERRLLLKVGAVPERMSLLPNIVETSLFRPAGKRHGKVVLFANHMILPKGPHIALQIAENILRDRKDITFVFMGIGAMKAELMRRAAQIDSKRLVFVRYPENDRRALPRRAILEWYQKATVMILPSYYEAFSKILAESLSCGTPVVATRVGGVPEVVLHGKTGFLAEYGDWESFRKYVELLVDDQALNKRMGRAGRRHVREHFDIDVVVDKLDRIYRSIR